LKDYPLKAKGVRECVHRIGLGLAGNVFAFFSNNGLPSITRNPLIFSGLFSFIPDLGLLHN